ncbi:GMC family oxidoreductase [Streptomyces sp. NPDC002643]
MGAVENAYDGVEFDHVVVGAGSAGCVVARRLVDAGRRVLLVETGGRDDDPAIHDPGSLGQLWNSPSDYAYFTEPQAHADGTKVFWPRGRVLGGSSAINAMIYVRGHRADYDSWAADGATGWSYDDVLPYFKRSEDFEDGPSHYHGAGGPLGVSRNHRPNPVSSAFVEACVDSGLPLNDDCNAEDTLGAGLLHRTIRDGKRHTAWVAFLAPVLDNPLLTVLTGSRANRIVFDDEGTARGVEVERDGRPVTFRCSGDVILSGGTIGSAQLLLLSGIGPADELRALGIPVRADLPGVGRNLHDHTIAPMVWESPSLIPDGQENKLEAQYFARSDAAQPVPDLQPLMSHVPLPVPGYRVPASGHGWTVLAGHVRPLSRGSIRLRSADPADTPVLDPNYLADPADLAALVAAIRMTREIAAEKALADWRTVEIAPGPGVRSDAEIAAYVRRTLQSYHHQVGTCRMGTDPDSVVDPTLRVHGVPGLRVADASVMPSVPSGNTNAPAIMVGERCADFVRQVG